MPVELTSEAIVLRRSESGEADRRLTLLTRQYGKLDVVAKGARKSGNRLAGSSEPLVRAVFTWAEGKVRRYVTQVQPVSSFPGIRADFDRTLAALALAELAVVGLPYESPDPHETGAEGLYSLYTRAFEALETSTDWKSVLLWAESRLMDAEGVHPDWTTSAVSGRAMETNPAWVSPSAGGMVLAEESVTQHDRFQVSAESLVALDRIVKLESPPQTVRLADECLRTLLAFWRHTLDHRLPANQTVVEGLSA